MQNDKYKLIRYLAGGIVVLALVFFLASTMSHAGKTKVILKVIPADSTIIIDNKPGRAGTLYLKPGSHKFTASRSGFKTSSQDVELGGVEQKISLLPAPVSKEAFQWLSDNPDIQRQREALGSERAAQAGQAALKQTPIIRLLPVTSLQGPFSINYGPSASRKNGTFLVITDSSPKGRAAAIGWIRQHGYDPTDLEIRYQDFINPIVNEGGAE